MAANDIYEEIMQCIADGDDDLACELAQRGIDQGVSPLDLIDKGFTPALQIIKRLTEAGATVCAYDPEAMDNAKAMLSHNPRVRFAGSHYDALEGADAIDNELEEMKKALGKGASEDKKEG